MCSRLRSLAVATALVNFIIVLSQPTSQSMNITGTNCTFHYRNLYGTGFHFDNCQKGVLNIDNWNTCLQQCCPKMTSFTYSPSLYALQVCQVTNSPGSSMADLLFIPLLCVGGLIVLILLICLFNHCRKKDVIVHDEHREVTSVEWPEENNNFSKSVDSLKWTQNTLKKEGLPDKTDHCSICLEEGPTAQLVCKHYFHVPCLGQWFKKARSCPSCRRDNICGIKAYCKICRWNYQVCTSSLLSVSHNQIRSLCPFCSDSSMIPASSSDVLMGQSQKTKLVVQDIQEIEGS